MSGISVVIITCTNLIKFDARGKGKGDGEGEGALQVNSPTVGRCQGKHSSVLYTSLEQLISPLYMAHWAW